ncbi:MAG: hypothetical protein V4732_15355 [Pseudomonadota bacterium]
MDKRTDTKMNLEFLDHFLLEDEIYLRVDKLQALCSAQIIMDSSDNVPTRHIRTYYSMIIEEQIIELRDLLNQLFT